MYFFLWSFLCISYLLILSSISLFFYFKFFLIPIWIFSTILCWCVLFCFLFLHFISHGFCSSKLFIFSKHFFVIFSFTSLSLTFVGTLLIFCFFHSICLCRSYLLRLFTPFQGAVCSYTVLSLRSGLWGCQAMRGTGANPVSQNRLSGFWRYQKD